MPARGLGARDRISRAVAKRLPQCGDARARAWCSRRRVAVRCVALGFLVEMPARGLGARDCSSRTGLPASSRSGDARARAWCSRLVASEHATRREWLSGDARARAWCSRPHFASRRKAATSMWRCPREGLVLATARRRQVRRFGLLGGDARARAWCSRLLVEDWLTREFEKWRCPREGLVLATRRQ